MNEKNTPRFNWKSYAFLLLLVALGAMAKVPAAVFMQGLAERPDLWARLAALLFAQDFVIMGLIPAGVGLLLLGRLGRRLPLIQDWIGEGEEDARFPRVVGEAFLWAAGLAAVGLLIQAVTRPMILRDLSAVGIDPALVAQSQSAAPWWAMGLLSFSAGVVEEVAFRLGLLTLLVWLGSLLWKARDGEVRPGVFWAANLLIALAFSLAHFANLAAAGLPLGAGLILRTVTGNSVASLVFGWLYWRRGLVSAMLAHMLLDGLIYVVVPWVGTLLV